MAATTEKVKSDALDKPLLNKVNLTLGVLLYLTFYSFIRWYEGVYAGQLVWTHSRLSSKHIG